MKVLGIMGSPRLKSNTDMLLDEALKGAADSYAVTDKLVVHKHEIQPCMEYYGCTRDGNCVIRDDMDDIYPRLVSADVIIVASPIFFYGLTAQLKALIDRSQAIWARKYILKQQVGPENRKGAFIGVGATRGKELFEGSILTVKYFFKALDVEYAGELLVRGVDKMAEIQNHDNWLKEAYALGQKLTQEI
jgi:multimeric flavodoxin WrbA